MIKRVLGAARLSVAADESTSIERQTEQIELWAELHNHEVVTVTVDTDVSGAISPFKRDGIGPWLTDPARIAGWDVLVVAKLDRATLPGSVDDDQRSTGVMPPDNQSCRRMA